MLPPDFQWQSHASTWGEERWLCVGKLPVGVVAQLDQTCWLSRRNLDESEWMTTRASSREWAVTALERWACAHVRALRLLNADGATCASEVPHAFPETRPPPVPGSPAGRKGRVRVRHVG